MIRSLIALALTALALAGRARAALGGADLSAAHRPGGGRRPYPVGPDQGRPHRQAGGLEQKTGDQLVVVTLPSLQGYEIEDYGYQLGRAWGIGQKGKNNGVVFIVAPSEHKVRIEVGYGLEPILTDALSSVILQEQVLPKFRAGDFDGGVVAGTDAIIDQLGLDPAQAQANAQAATAQQPVGTRPSIRSPVIIAGDLRRLRHARPVRPPARRRPVGAAVPVHGRRAQLRRLGGGGGFGGSGGGGGGFSGGGGGSFGGGGASGSW